MILKLLNIIFIWGMGLLLLCGFFFFIIYDKNVIVYIYSKCIMYVFILKIWYLCDDFLKIKMLNYFRKIFYLCDINFYVCEVWVIVD